MSSLRCPLSERFPRRATSWQLQDRLLQFGSRPLLMGIVNVTPDSFSDGGHFLDSKAAIAQGLRLAAEGADVLDIGGESTRPYADSVGTDEELNRILPVVEALAGRVDIPLSIDTSKQAVARAALAVGAEIINDVTGLESDPKMLPLAAEMDAGICAMHMQGTPQTMQDAPTYEDIVKEICAYLQARRDALIASGIAAERICLDPGIGFGKTHQHNIRLMSQCWRFHELGCPLLVGHSRKGFLAKILGDKTSDRGAATIGGALALAVQGVQLIRVHDVRPVREALLAFEATGGIDGQEQTLAD
ncbi:MAG: dihydropteroate synthase [Planctomycetes bacterium]|nr:dihydropteroate synthase [Planctomycetota bacterium]